MIMNFEKLMLSFYGKNGKVVRVSIDSIFVYCLIILVAAPYMFLFFKKSPSEQAVAKVSTQQTLKAPVVYAPVTPSPNVKIGTPIKQEIAVSQAAVSKSFQYKFTSPKVNLENNVLSVSFLLSKAKVDGRLTSGSIFIEALDDNGNVIAASTKSIFKFQTARLSSFQVVMPNDTKVSKIRLKVIENGLESFTFL